MLRIAKLTVVPGAASNCVAYKPAEVASAIDVFADVDAYVHISSDTAYGNEVILKYEDKMPFCGRTDKQVIDDSGASYGPWKAEGDHVVSEVASRGANAMSVRPRIVYGPDGYTERLDYQVDRMLDYDRAVVPGNGTNVWHRAYIKDVASTMRVVAEEGEAGEAYNIGDRQLATPEEMVEAITDIAGTDVKIVRAGERELAAAGLPMDDSVLYHDYPCVLSTNRLARLGQESTSVEGATRWPVANHRDSNRDGAEHDPGRNAEERVLSILDTL